jgi:hypothetical protein
MKSLVAGAALALLVATPGLAQDVKAEAEAYAVNNALSAVYHEFGHLFVDQYELPILGNEEDVADAIATLLLLRQADDAAAAISYDTVDGYLKSSELYGESEPGNVDYNDEHGLDVQRASQMTCLLVGGDPDTYTDLADQVGLDAERQEGCAEEYDTATRGWDKMMNGHLRSSAPEGAKLTVAYDDATGKYGPIAELLRRDKTLERAAATVTAEFALTRPATVRATTCDEENAFYDGDADEITLCYEYVQFYFDLIADPDNAGMESEEE